MNRLFLLVAFLVLGKISYSQYPLTQNLGSDSTIVVSKGATQSRFVNVTYVDTAAANLQRIRQYPGAQIVTTGSGSTIMWIRNTTATGWLRLPAGTATGNIYTIDGTLTGTRNLSGSGFPLTFSGLDKFVVLGDSIRFTAGNQSFALNTDSGSITKKLSYSGNYSGDFKQYTLVDKNYVDSVVTSSPAGTVTSIATDNGTGITGGTITSTGTLAIDTTIISTRAWRQKGIDSVAALPKVTSVGLTMPIAFNVSGSPVTSAGTLSVTAAGVASQYIRGDGQLATLPTTGGGGSSVSYYLNGSVNQGTFGGNTYYQMNKTPVIGTGTDFTISSNGYIASFITDAGDPDLLNIPAGNWDFEIYFQSSSSSGTPSFYVELYKYNGTTFTLIASSSTNPEFITGGTNVDAYYTPLAVPATTLAITDRLAIRVYVNNSGNTITLHTEDNNLCQVITTFSTGINALNGLTDQVQYFAVGTSGTDFNISSLTDTHTFNLPTASATNRGALSSADWTTFNGKVGGSGISGQVSYFNGTNSITSSPTFAFTPTSQLLVNNSVTASGAIARGINATPSLTAAANNDVLVGLDINPTFSNGAFSGVQNSITRINLGVAKTFTSASPNAFAIRTNDASQEQVLYLSYLGNTNAANRSFIFQTTENNVAFNGNIVLQNQGGRVLIGANTFSTGTTFEVTGASRFNGNIALGATSIWDNTNGRLGINTTTPGSRLVVVQSSGTIASFTNGVDADLQVSTVTSTTTMATSVGALALGATSTEAMRIFASTRNVLIQNGGTFTDAGFRLDVNGSVRFGANLTANDVLGNLNFRNGSNAAYIMQENSTARSIQIPGTGGNAHWIFNNSGAGWGLQGIFNNGTFLTRGDLITFTTANFAGNSLQVIGINGTQAQDNRNIYIGNNGAQYANEKGTNIRLIAGIGGTSGGDRVGGDIYLTPGAGGGVAAAGNVILAHTGSASQGNVMVGSATNDGSRLQVSGSITAASAIARGVNFTNTLVAAANNDVLVGLDVNPTFTNGAFTGVMNYGARIQGIIFGRGSGGVDGNVAIGAGANITQMPLGKNTTGSSNIAIGYQALSQNTTGSSNVAIGFNALFNGTVTGCIAIGADALANGSNVNNTVAIGNAAFGVFLSGANNVGVGAAVLNANSSGANNTALGTRAGRGASPFTNANTTGTNNIFIGYESVGVSASDNNRTWIGNSSTTSTWLAGNVLIGTTTDAGFRLDVNGTARVQGAITGTAGMTLAGLLNNSANEGRFNYLATGGAAANTSYGITVGAGRGILLQSGGNTIIDFANGSSNNLTLRSNTTNLNSFGALVFGNTTADRSFFTMDLISNTALFADNIGIIATSIPMQASALVAMNSTTKGFLQPRMTTAQRDAISTPATGLSVYNTSTNTNDFYNGTSWVSQGSASGASGQVAYFSAANALTSSATFAFTPTSQLLVNNSITAASAIARGVNVTSSLTAAANNDVLVGLDINPTFTNGAFTGVNNYGIRYNSSNAITPFFFQSTVNGTAYTYNTLGGNNDFFINSRDVLTSRLRVQNGGANGVLIRSFNNTTDITNEGTNNRIILYNSNYFYSTGNVGINQNTDAGFRLDVNGTARVQGDLTVNGGIARQSSGTTVFTMSNSGGANAAQTFLYNNSAGWTGFSFGRLSDFRYIFEMRDGYTNNYGQLFVTTATNSGTTLPTAPNASAQLQIDATTRGFLQPRMTTAQRDAISTPATGLSVYNTSTNTNDYYNGSAWLNVGQVLVPANNTTGFSISGSSLTGSSAQSLVSLSQTWNTTGNPTAFLLNITNTASGATADLMELQAGGVAQFIVGKTGSGYFKDMLTIEPQTANTGAIKTDGYSLTGSNAQSLLSMTGTWNTTGNPTAIKLDITNTASGANSYLMDLQVGSATQFRVTKAGAIRTAAPTTGTANDWKLGSVVGGTTVLDTTQWLEVEVGGTLYRVALVTLPEPEPGATPASTPEDRKISAPVKTSSQRIQELENEIQELRKMINFLMPTSKNKE